MVPDLTGTPLSDLVSLTGRTAVVTGAGAGVGAAIAERLAEAGGNVVVADRDKEAAQAQADALEARGWSALAAVADVTDTEAVAALADTAVQRFGALDIWVNNAGAYPSSPLMDITDEQWDRLLQLNLRGSFTGAREAARRMIDAGRPGVIINISSGAAFVVGGGNAAHYVASKHGVVGLTKSLAVELGPHGIRAVSVAPTLTETPGVAYKREVEQLGDVLDAYGAQLPLGRTGRPDDIARTVLFAASDLAAFVTGTVLVVDGGDLAS
ncbi:SDR family NAD(P)-dependent oxidoreductase [Streptomyces sp. NPDC096311]|uniref:SDR family NAD(P)-dependent oxidoreductase n=1 Tax=Streptomyces sp. NPDC096311 TaxID=3366083 RepID=UPI0038203410